jgi:hypothetical protein
MPVVMIECNNTGSLDYVTLIFGHLTDSLARWQTVCRWRVFQFAVRHSPHMLCKCTAVNIRFLHTVFDEDAGNFTCSVLQVILCFDSSYLQKVLENGFFWLPGVHNT